MLSFDDIGAEGWLRHRRILQGGPPRRQDPDRHLRRQQGNSLTHSLLTHIQTHANILLNHNLETVLYK